jgi:hypothetical protein
MLDGRRAAVKKVLKAGADRTEPLQIIKTHQNRRWRENFQGEGDEYKGWKQLSSWATDERGSAHPILQREGALKYVLFDQMENARLNKASITWTMRDVDGAFPASHQTGYKNPIKGRKRIPARIMWEFDGRDEGHAEAVITFWFAEQLEGL